MYEDLTFGDLIEAKRVSENSGVETLGNATVERKEGDTGPKLHLNNIGEGRFNTVLVDLIKGELKTENERRSNPDFDMEASNVEVSDDELTVTIERAEETISLVIECEGETNDDTGVDLGDLGIGM